MGEDQLDLQKEVAKLEIKTQTTAPVEQTAFAPLEQNLPQQQTAEQTVDNTQLMAWAIQQQGQVALPETSVYETYRKEKSWTKKEKTVVEQHTRQTPKSLARAQVLQERMPELYAQEGTQGLVELAGQEVETTFNNRLEGASDQGLVLLDKLSKAQKQVTPALVAELRTEMQSMGLQTGEERIPYEGVFEDAEVLVLMSANLSHHLLERMEAAEADKTTHSSAYEGMLSVAHTTNTYANAIVSKVTKERSALIEQKRAQALSAQERQAEEEARLQGLLAARLKADQEETQRQLALAKQERERLEAETQRQEDLSRQALVDNDRRKANLARIAQQIAQENINQLDGVLDETQRSELEAEVAFQLGHDVMKADLGEGAGDEQAFLTDIRSALSRCNTFQEAVARQQQEPQQMKDFLLQNGVSEAELGLYQDQRDFRLALRQGQDEALAWLTPIKAAVETNRNLALAYVKGYRGDLTEQQQQALVQVKMELTPELFSAGSQTDVTTQMGLFLRYQQLYAPQLAVEVAQTKADNTLIATPVPQIENVEQSQMIDSLAMLMSDHAVLYRFLPEQGREAYLEQVVSGYLKDKKTPFADMKPAQKATLIPEILAILQAQTALIAPILQDENAQVWVGLTAFLLAEKPLNQLQAKILELRTVAEWEGVSPESASALQVVNPLVNHGGEIPLDYRDNAYSTDFFGKNRELRGERRLARLDEDLAQFDVGENWLFKGFVVEQIGSKDLNQPREVYENRLKEVVTRAKENQVYLEKTLSPFLFENAEAYERALLNLGSAVVSQDAQAFQTTVETAKQGLSKTANPQAEQVTEMDARRQGRIDGLKERFPTLKAQEGDLRKLLASEDAQMHLCIQGEGQWLDFITPIINNAVPVLAYIDKMYSSMQWLPDQLRLGFHDEIYSGKMTLEEGKVKFSDYHKTLSAMEIQKTKFESKSLNQSIKKLLDDVFKTNENPEEQAILKDYFSILLNDSSMNEVLNLEKTWDKKKGTIGKQILTNHKAMEAFVGEQTQEPARVEGFKLFVRGAVSSQTEAEFKQNLSQMWTEFTILEGSAAAVTAMAAQTMAARMDSLLEVDAQRQKAVDRQAEDNAQKERLYSVQAGKQSVFKDAGKGTIDRLPRRMKLVKKEVQALKTQNARSEQGVQSPVPLDGASDILAEYLARKPLKELPADCAKWGVANIGKLEQAYRDSCATANVEPSENLLCKVTTLALSLYGNMLLQQEGMSLVQMTGVVADAVGRDAQLLREGTQLGDHAALLEMQSLTMDKKRYDKAVTTAKDTIARDKAIDQLVKAELKKGNWSPEEQAAIQNGWQVYRYSDCLKLWETNHQGDMQTLLQTDLLNPTLVDTLRAVGNRSILESYQTKGTMEAVGATSATKKEQQMASKVAKTREDFEGYLSSRGGETVLKAYNQFTVEQRLLFAFGLSMPQKLLNLQTGATGKILQRSNTQASDLAVSTLQDYIYQGTTLEMEKLDYQRAMATLEGEAGKTYEVALDFVAFCTKARQETVPVNTPRLTDAQQSIQAAGNLAPERECSTVEELKVYIQEQTAQDRSDINQGVQALTADQMTLLLVALQNRTLLDKSTIPDADNFVDQDQREELIGQFSDNYAQALLGQAPSALLGKAVLSLQSYQVRDGIVLGDNLQRSDLAEQGLQRTTEIDIALLQSALELVREIEQKATRLQAIRSANKVIDKSENQGARDSYAQHKGTVTTQEKFQEYINHQIQGQLSTVLGSALLDEASSEAVGLFAAYQDLDAGQRNLFFKALGSRDLLDISKEGIMANRFGLRERDYVNEAGRNNLLDEFAMTGNVVLEGDGVAQAFTGILSTQVDDTVDFTASQDVVAAQTSSRKTPVDWKLFKRGIQLVRRATEERKTRQNHFELYAGSGEVHTHGEFQFKSDFLRRNLHNAGNRFTRFLGRRVAANVQDSLSDYLGDTLSEKATDWMAGKLAGTDDITLSAKEEVKLPGAKQLEYSENFLDVVKDARKSSAMVEGKETALGMVKDVISKGIEDVSEETAFGLGMVEHGQEVYESVVNYKKINRAIEEAEVLQEQDKGKVLAAHKRQTAAEQQRFDGAIQKANEMLRQAATMGKSRQVDKGISAVGESINDVGGSFIMEAVPLAETVGRLAREAAELINFARSAFSEKGLVDRNLQAQNYWESRRENLKTALPQMANQRVQTYAFALAASGFENMTEYATAKGMEFVQSLLFAASKYNTMASSKLLAETVLETLELKQVGKDYDTLNAKAVFDRLMGMNR
ncbi:hypothetical protein RFF05_09940 [Bengtsoniella intestinalis]|uniref:hypothetical protein n=1 Tax=Bengtsoniella intestinalis TaxID=3073143 RepID=UPI00391F641F